ncbi:hypothetical protein [Streptomyces sp. NRRL F-2799]
MCTLPVGDRARLRPPEPWQAPEFLAHIDRARPPRPSSGAPDTDEK